MSTKFIIPGTLFCNVVRPSKSGKHVVATFRVEGEDDGRRFAMLFPIGTDIRPGLRLVKPTIVTAQKLEKGEWQDIEPATVPSKADPALELCYETCYLDDAEQVIRPMSSANKAARILAAKTVEVEVAHATPAPAGAAA